MCRLAAFLPAALLVLTCACSEDSYGPPRRVVADSPAASVAAEAEKQQKPTEPVLVVGGVTMPMPVPDGFKRLPLDHPLARARQTAAGSEEVLLCIFERADSAGAAPGLEALLQRDSLQVSTLRKFLDVEVSSLDFLKIKEPWQRDSVEFNQNTLNYFAEAASGRLADAPQFSYNMGMIDSSPLHISFLKVLKHTAPAGEVIYTCSTTSLIWRYGKVLSISYNKLINDFGQIQAAVAESVGYLQKIQAIDRTTRISASESVSDAPL